MLLLMLLMLYCCFGTNVECCYVVNVALWVLLIVGLLVPSTGGPQHVGLLVVGGDILVLVLGHLLLGEILLFLLLPLLESLPQPGPGQVRLHALFVSNVEDITL